MDLGEIDFFDSNQVGMLPFFILSKNTQDGWSLSETFDEEFFKYVKLSMATSYIEIATGRTISKEIQFTKYCTKADFDKLNAGHLYEEDYSEFK